MGAESDINVVIGSLLLIAFSQVMPYYCVRRGTKVVVEGNLANTRFPDLLVVTKAAAKALARKKRSIITLDMAAPQLVVEVVSNSSEDRRSRDRDYVDKRKVDKRKEYAQRGVLEYWIVDPSAMAILILSLVDGAYLERSFSGEDGLVSPMFPKLSLKASQVLNAGTENAS